MKTAAVLLLSCAFLCCAQQDDSQQAVKRLESVTWDLATHKLVWTVSKGSVVDGQFVPAAKMKYEVSPDEAFMAFAGEQKSFSLEEAVALHQLLDALSIYCAQSVVWWDKSPTQPPAEGAPTELTKPERKETKPPVQPDTRPVKVGLIAFKYR